jgi:hypothetical protein
MTHAHDGHIHFQSHPNTRMIIAEGGVIA